MITDIKTIATLLATEIWADGEYDEAEKITVSEIADACEIDEDELQANVDAAVADIAEMDEYEVNACLQRAADMVDDEEIGIVFEAAMQLAISDGELAEEEVTELLAIANALGITEEIAILLLADMVKTEPDLEISFK